MATEITTQDQLLKFTKGSVSFVGIFTGKSWRWKMLNKIDDLRQLCRWAKEDGITLLASKEERKTFVWFQGS